MSDLAQLARRYQNANTAAQDANRTAKAAAAEKQHAKTQLRRALEAAELESVKVDGRVASVYELAFAKVDDRAAFEEWAREEAEEDFFEPEARVRADLLNQLVRSKLDDNEPLPPGLGFYLDERISVQQA